MRVSETQWKDLKKNFRGELKNTSSKMAKEGLLISLAFPYLAWLLLTWIINSLICGNLVILDIIVVLYSGICLWQRYGKRDSDETLGSRSYACLAAGCSMIWIGIVYNLFTTILIGLFASKVETPILTLFLAICTKISLLFAVKNFVEPDKKCSIAKSVITNEKVVIETFKPIESITEEDVEEIEEVVVEAEKEDIEEKKSVSKKEDLSEEEKAIAAAFLSGDLNSEDVA